MLVVLAPSDHDPRLREQQVVLVGKDGRSTLQWSKTVNSEVLFSVIDKMPMRREKCANSDLPLSDVFGAVFYAAMGWGPVARAQYRYRYYIFWSTARSAAKAAVSPCRLPR